MKRADKNLNPHHAAIPTSGDVGCKYFTVFDGSGRTFHVRAAYWYDECAGLPEF